jgi:hypothetical protein
MHESDNLVWAAGPKPQDSNSAVPLHVTPCDQTSMGRHHGKA